MKVKYLEHLLQVQVGVEAWSIYVQGVRLLLGHRLLCRQFNAQELELCLF